MTSISGSSGTNRGSRRDNGSSLSKSSLGIEIQDIDEGRESTSHVDLSAQFYKKFLHEMSSTLWTLHDQRKLKALHDIHDRMVEYHNNIHTKDSSTYNRAKKEEDDVEDQVIQSAIVMAYAVHFYATEDLPPSYSANLSTHNVHTLTYGQLEEFCRDVQKNLRGRKKGDETVDNTMRSAPSRTITFVKRKKEDSSHCEGFTWIHLKDLLALETISKHFKIHDLAMSGFNDLRTHSTILPCAPGECLMSLVVCGMEGNDFHAYKLYIYMSPRLVITFQTELIPDIKTLHFSCACSEKLVQPIFDNFVKIRKKCIQLGPAYLLYELGLQALRVWDSSLEFISYALSYFRKIVGLKLLHGERLELMIKMNVIQSGAAMFQNQIEEVNNVFTIIVSALMDVSGGGMGKSGKGREGNGDMGRPGGGLHRGGALSSIIAVDATTSDANTVAELINNNSSVSDGYGVRRYLVPHILNEELHMPYFVDLSDSFLFTDSCVQNIVNDLGRVGRELDAAMQLRTTNTSIILSLVATVFWPLTFISTVFGMNFAIGGGFTMDMLNSSQGVNLFIMMCVVSGIFTFSYFFKQGWFEMNFLIRPLRRLRRGNKARINDDHTSQPELAELRAAMEETRRKEESSRQRGFGKAARNVEVFHQKQSIAVNNSPLQNPATPWRP